MKRLLFLGAAVTVGVLAVVAARSIAKQDRQVDELEALRATLDQARLAADSCQRALTKEEEEFLRFDRVVDSLGRAAEGYEDPDQGGVPQADYHDYLETFEFYNDSVEAWQPRADGLKANEARCRLLIETHNELGDSIRTRQEELMGGGRYGGS
jgi:hypothetical protein